MKIYYAHHLWKYNTNIEKNEIDLIKECFPSAKLINPNTDIKQDRESESIMLDCFKLISDCNVLIFSAVNGIIGKGIYREINNAKQLGVKTYYIFYKKLFCNYKITIRENKNNKEYANVFLEREL